MPLSRAPAICLDHQTQQRAKTEPQRLWAPDSATWYQSLCFRDSEVCGPRFALFAAETPTSCVVLQEIEVICTCQKSTPATSTHSLVGLLIHTKSARRHYEEPFFSFECTVPLTVWRCWPRSSTDRAHAITSVTIIRDQPWSQRSLSCYCSSPTTPQTCACGFCNCGVDKVKVQQGRRFFFLSRNKPQRHNCADCLSCIER